MLSWTGAADHTPASQPLPCPGVVALGSAERTCWDPFNEGESLGFSVLHAWGLGDSQQQIPWSRKRPWEPVCGAVSLARPQTRWGEMLCLGCSELVTRAAVPPPGHLHTAHEDGGMAGVGHSFPHQPPPPQAWNRLGTGREGGAFTSVSPFAAGPGAAGMDAGRGAGRQEAQPPKS